MQVYDVRTRRPEPHPELSYDRELVLDDGATSAYRVACTHEQRAVIEQDLNPNQRLVSCAECGAALGVAPRPCA